MRQKNPDNIGKVVSKVANRVSLKKRPRSYLSELRMKRWTWAKDPDDLLQEGYEPYASECLSHRDLQQVIDCLC